MLVVDMISPAGHLALNEFVVGALRKLDGSGVCGVFKRSYQSLNDGEDSNFCYFPEFKLLRIGGVGDEQGWRHYLMILFFMFFLFFSRPFFNTYRNDKKVLFLSYNPLSHLALFAVLKVFGFDIYCFEHNSIPSKRSRFFNVKSFFFSACSKFVVHLVFEDYISDYLRNEYRTKVLVIPHPCLASPRVGDYYTQKSSLLSFFSPSGSTKNSFITRLETYADEIGAKLYIKSTSYSSRRVDTIVSKYFENYMELMGRVDCVMIGCDFDYRVSGVFYEALAAKTKILMSDCVFARNVGDKYPNVFVFNHDTFADVIRACKEQDITDYYNVEAHNKIIETKLSLILDGKVVR
ncbi:hypothetical protein ACFFK7_08100 [Pseudoalteromonas xiamenensis]|uniref:hypothetical protein n=1 Tax=Pseudoalteromonas xiamenensis TaxID=882626 RepID=UPI0035E522AA